MKSTAEVEPELTPLLLLYIMLFHSSELALPSSPSFSPFLSLFSAPCFYRSLVFL